MIGVVRVMGRHAARAVPRPVKRYFSVRSPPAKYLEDIIRKRFAESQQSHEKFEGFARDFLLHLRPKEWALGTDAARVFADAGGNPVSLSKFIAQLETDYKLLTAFKKARLNIHDV